MALEAPRGHSSGCNRRSAHLSPVVLWACLVWAGCSGGSPEAEPSTQGAAEIEVYSPEEPSPLHTTDEPSLAPEASASGGIVLEPNTIRGRVRFTNQNPEILALLDSDPHRFPSVSATSTSPQGYGATVQPDAPNLRGFEFEMQVEAAAGGSEGVSYLLQPRWYMHAGRYPDRRTYDFQPVSVQVRPRSQQPEPTEVDVAECIGVLRLQFGTDETCTTPVPVLNLYLNGGYVSMPSATTHHLYFRGGSSGTSTLYYLTGSNSYVDTIRHTQTLSWNSSCDEVATRCVVVPGPEELGSLTGPWQLVGEQPSAERFLAAYGGPSSNYRHSYSLFELEAPAAEPSRWWSLLNMPGGKYSVLYGRGGLRLGREYTYFYTQHIQAEVTAGQANPLTRMVDGELRYPFVMHPAFLHGSIRLVDPYVPAHPGTRSSLEALSFEADFDRDGNGVPDYPNLYSTTPATRYTTSLFALQLPPSNILLASSMTSFPGHFEPATGELASSYELPLLSAYDLPLSWQPTRLRLGFSSEGYATATLPRTRPGQYDPARFRYGHLDLFPKQAASAPLGAGQSHRVDHEYCLNEVQVEYSTTGSLFYNPTATIQGGFRGQDWMGQQADYSVQGRAWGIPAALGIPQSEAVTYAQPHGSISFALPQGSYTVTPGATLVNAQGQANEATFQPMSLTVGCGQRLKLVPPLTVSIESQSLCAASPSMTVTGRVRSSPAEVDRIWYLREDGQEVTLCTQCGIDPAFSFPVTLNACDNDIQVFAFTEGMPEPALGQARVVWDDPADGPSCAGSQCVNHAPVARCRGVTVGADAAGTGCASVDDGSYDPDEGDSFSCVQSPACSYPLGSHRVTLTCTDSEGLSSSCESTVTVKDLTPPTLSCPNVSLECVEGGAVASFSPVAQDDQGEVGLVCSPASGASLPLGTTTTTCTAMDAAGNRASCAFPVNVQDTLAPHVSPLPGPSIIECAGASYVDPGATAMDLCGGDLTASIQTTSTLDPSRPGSYEVTYSVTDAFGHVGRAVRSLQVVDALPPVLQTSEVELWPPNHEPRSFTLADCASLVDACDSTRDINALGTIVSIFSDEPEDMKGSGDGRTREDISITGPSSFQLRAERNGRGNGRVYGVNFMVQDASGNPSQGTCYFRVPHDRSGSTAVNDGPAQGYTVPVSNPSP